MAFFSYETFLVSMLIKALTHFIMLRSCLGKSITANFVFGDSLVDVGNNNYIVSLSKADYVPNGIDFGKPTGRFTNGRTVVDIIGKHVQYFH